MSLALTQTSTHGSFTAKTERRRNAGSDGLTARQRAIHADRFAATVGAPPTRRELDHMANWLRQKRAGRLG